MRRAVNGNKYIIIIGCLVLLVTSCSVPTPQERFLDLYTALISNDLIETHTYFIYSDRVTISKEEFNNTYTLSIEERQFIEKYYDHITYTLHDVSITGDTAFAKLHVQVPVFMEPLMYLVFYAVDSVVVPDRPVLSDTAGNSLRMITGSLRWVKEEHNWYVQGNWGEQRQIDAELAQERLEYIQEQLSIANIRVYEKSSGQAGLTASLRNKGDRALKEVEIYIVCITKENRPCYTVSAQPLVSEPLAPRSTRRFSIDLTQAPTNWSRRVEVKILNCQFLQ